MDALLKQRDEIEEKLKELKSIELTAKYQAEALSKSIEEKTEMYSRTFEAVGRMKVLYKEKREKLFMLKELLDQLRELDKDSAKLHYRRQFDEMSDKLNNIRFPFKISIFKVFESMRTMKTEPFPNLNNAKNKLIEKQKNMLRTKLAEEIRNIMGEPSKLNDLIFYINFVVKYETYFSEDLLCNILYRNIQRKFLYHFQSDRSTNRLDKPEWIFSFLLAEYLESLPVFKLYVDCGRTLEQPTKDFGCLIDRTYSLIAIKVREVMQSATVQRYRLAMHFADEFVKFNSELSSKYSFGFSAVEVGHMLFKLRREYTATELEKIHELRYIQWFPAYKELCKTMMIHICKYGMLDRDTRLEDLIEPILLHTKIFIDNLRFVNREEIQIVCHLFTDLEDLRSFLYEEEAELQMNFEHSPEGLAEDSLEKIHQTNSSILRLIEGLAEGDMDEILKSIRYFTYASEESKRSCIIDIHKIIEDYKYCACYDRIEDILARRADEFFKQNILEKVLLSQTDLCNFEMFYKSIKEAFKERDWRTDGVLEAIRTVKDGKRVSKKSYKKIIGLYESESTNSKM